MPLCKEASRLASKQANKQASRQASKEASRRASWQASKQTSRHASKRASRRASRQARRQAGERSIVVRALPSLVAGRLACKVDQKHNKNLGEGCQLAPEVQALVDNDGVSRAASYQFLKRLGWEGVESESNEKRKKV